MKYSVVFKPRAVKDLKGIDLKNRTRILKRIEGLENDLDGDVKRLTNFTPEYRLRAGDFRVLFETEGAYGDNLSNQTKKGCLRVEHD